MRILLDSCIWPGALQEIARAGHEVEWVGAWEADENPSGLGIFDLPLRLPGQYFDQETGLHYNYFRDYDPSIGRYGESDPIGLNGGLNTYAYVGGSPVRFTDPKGLTSVAACANPVNAAVCAEAGIIVGGAAAASSAINQTKPKEICFTETWCTLVVNLNGACLYRCDDFTLQWILGQADCKKRVRKDEL